MNIDSLKIKAKQVLSIVNTSTVKDAEIEMWINSAILDMKRQGIEVIVEITENNETTLSIKDDLVTGAIMMFVKANFGNTDIKEKELAQKTYSLLCTNLSLSSDYKEEDINA